MKQVIVIRTDLGMGKGKMCAQAAHASIVAAFNARARNKIAFGEWFAISQAKIVVKVESDTELMDIYAKAVNAGLPCSMIKDAALTQLEMPAYTAVGIGPCKDEDVDKITGGLKLL